LIESLGVQERISTQALEEAQKESREKISALVKENAD